MTTARYDDTGHPPSADFRYQAPTTEYARGPGALKVTLETWGPQDGLARILYQTGTQTWGDRPHRVRSHYEGKAEHDDYGMLDLSAPEQEFVRKMIAGKTLPQDMELVTFLFQIEGVTRAATHQLVRTRIGAYMKQHGGRDNDWRHQGMTIPETLARQFGLSPVDAALGLRSCVTDKEPLYQLRAWAAKHRGQIIEDVTLEDAVYEYVQLTKFFYSKLVDAGIPWQDARRFLPMLQTHIAIGYNWVALKGVLANRLELIMDWEINCISQLMMRELRMKCPHWLIEGFGSHSDQSGAAKFHGMKIRPPDQKYAHPYDPCEYETTPEQNPFWVLTDAAMNGGPIEWIPTNGVYPGRPDGIQHKETCK